MNEDEAKMLFAMFLMNAPGPEDLGAREEQEGEKA